MGGNLDKQVFYKIKNSKPFEKSDVFLYASSLVILAVLFIVFVVFPTNKLSNGFNISLDGKTAIVINVKSRTYSIANEFADDISVIESEDGISFEIFTDDNGGYNVVYVNYDSMQAKVSDSNCSIRKDCVHTSPIKDSGVIVCAPHKLKVSLIGNTSDNPIVG